MGLDPAGVVHGDVAGVDQSGGSGVRLCRSAGGDRADRPGDYLQPAPSAPVAIAAGALFGHYWGTLYVFLGSVLGASTAFMLARVLGYAAIHRWVEASLPFKGDKNQRRLMVLVFASRLLPFISFELVSYAAGLTPLVFWRFLLATAAGILPASFLLAHVGGELTEFEPVQIVWIMALFALVFIAPLVWKALFGKGKKRKT